MAIHWNGHNSFEAGMFPDMPGYLIPSDGVYFARDMLFDQPGKARKRGGTYTPDYTLDFMGNLGNFISGIEGIPNQIMSAWKLVDDGEGGENIAHLQLFNRANDPNLQPNWEVNDVTITGLASGDTNLYMGRPFNHLGFQFVPMKSFDTGNNWFIVYGGTELDVGVAVVNPPYATATNDSILVTAGSNNITSGAIMDFGATCNRGDVVTITDSLSAPTYLYRGRVTEVNTSNIQVEPAPTVTATRALISFDHSVISPDYYGYGSLGSDIACSYQYRVVMGHPKRWKDNMVPEVGQQDYSRTVVWTTLPASFDGNVSNHSGLYLDGLVQSFRESVLRNNFFTFSDMTGEITALAPMNGQLVVFSNKETFVLTGTMETNDEFTTDSNTLASRNVSKSIGCLAKESLQYHPRGWIFASLDGVFIFDGSGFKATMIGRMANLWRKHMNNKPLIHGSALIFGNHYAISLEATNPDSNTVESYTYMLNVDTGAWTTLSNVDIFSAVDDPTFPGITWGVLYIGTEGQFNGGPIVRLDTMFFPGDFSISDSDGNQFDAVLDPMVKVPVTCDLITRAYAEGDTSGRKAFAGSQIGFWLLAVEGGIVNVSADTNLEPGRSDSNNTYKLLGSLANNFPNPVTGVTSTTGSAVIITSPFHGYSTGDQVIIEELANIPRLNGKWIVTVLTADTFSLNISKGKTGETWTSGGIIRGAEAKSFNTLGTLSTGNAISYKIELTKETYQFEVLSLKNGFKLVRPGRSV